MDPQQAQALYEAYQSGRMTPEDAAAFEGFVNSGEIQLPGPVQMTQALGAPRESAAPESPVPDVVPDGVSRAYLSGEMSEDDRAGLEQMIESGQVRLPSAPPETTIGGLAGGISREFGPLAAGAATGAGIGALAGGVGAIPGAIAGAGAVGLTQLIGDPLISGVNSLLGTEFTTPTEAWATLFDQLGVPEPDSSAEKLVQAAARGAAGAVGGVGAGAALGRAAAGPVSRGVGTVLAAQPATQTVAGATGGLAAESARQAGVGPLGQSAAGLAAGGLTGAGMSRLGGATVTRGSTEAARRLQTIDDAGLKALTSDVVPPKSFAARWLQHTSEKIPLAGTGPVRASQQAGRVARVKELLREFGSDASDLSDDVLSDLKSKRSADLQRFKRLKGDVIERLSGEEVPVPNAMKAIDEQIAILRSQRTKQLSGAVEVLEDWKQAIGGQDLRNIERLRRQLGEAFTSPELAGARSAGEDAVSSIYGPLREDMSNFIRRAGTNKDHTKWQVANRELSKLAGELEVNALKRVLRKGDATPELIDKLLFSKNKSDVKLLYRGLNPRGKAAARAAVLAKAAEKAGGIENISPDRFASEVKRLGTSVGVLFKGRDLQQVKGLTRALELTQRASQANVAPPTGVQVAIPVVASVLTSILGSVGGAIGAGAGVGGFARLYESAPFRNALVRMSKVRMGSAEEAAAFKRLATVIRFMGVTEDE